MGVWKLYVCVGYGAKKSIIFLNSKIAKWSSFENSYPVTKNIFNLQERHQNMQNCKSYSSKSLLFIKHSQWEWKLKTCQEWPDLVCGHFIKVFCETTTCLMWPAITFFVSKMKKKNLSKTATKKFYAEKKWEANIRNIA